jgi:hypothetical protein
VLSELLVRMKSGEINAAENQPNGANGES